MPILTFLVLQLSWTYLEGHVPLFCLTSWREKAWSWKWWLALCRELFPIPKTSWTVDGSRRKSCILKVIYNSVPQRLMVLGISLSVDWATATRPCNRGLDGAALTEGRMGYLRHEQGWCVAIPSRTCSGAGIVTRS